MRERTGLTVNELSERSGITAARIEAVERGEPVADDQLWQLLGACYEADLVKDGDARRRRERFAALTPAERVAEIQHHVSACYELRRALGRP